MFDIQTFCLLSVYFFSPQNEETACNHHSALATFQGRAHSSLQPAVEDKQVNKRRLLQAGFQCQNLLFNQHEKLWRKSEVESGSHHRPTSADSSHPRACFSCLARYLASNPAQRQPLIPKPKGSLARLNETAVKTP